MRSGPSTDSVRNGVDHALGKGALVAIAIVIVGIIVVAALATGGLDFRSDEQKLVDEMVDLTERLK